MVNWLRDSNTRTGHLCRGFPDRDALLQAQSEGRKSLTRIAQVLVAVIRKWSVPLPPDSKDLYELDVEEYEKSGKFRIDHSHSLRLVYISCLLILFTDHIL